MVPSSAFRSVKLKVIDFDANNVLLGPSADGDWHPVRYSRVVTKNNWHFSDLNEIEPDRSGFASWTAKRGNYVMREREREREAIHLRFSVTIDTNIFYQLRIPSVPLLIYLSMELDGRMANTQLTFIIIIVNRISPSGTDVDARHSHKWSRVNAMKLQGVILQ
jgi:hypothetical protein